MVFLMIKGNITSKNIINNWKWKYAKMKEHKALLRNNLKYFSNNLP